MQRLADGIQRDAAVGLELPSELNPRLCLGESWAPTLPAPGPRRGQAGFRPFLDQATFELSERREDVEDQFPGRTGRVDHAVADRTEPDPLLTQVPDDGDEMPHGSAEPVQSPDDQGVAGLQRLQAASEAEVVELFNIAKDPNETTNLVETEPDKLQELRARYEALAGQAAPPKVAPAVPGFRSPKVWGEHD